MRARAPFLPVSLALSIAAIGACGRGDVSRDLLGGETWLLGPGDEASTRELAIGEGARLELKLEASGAGRLLVQARDPRGAELASHELSLRRGTSEPLVDLASLAGRRVVLSLAVPTGEPAVRVLDLRVEDRPRPTNLILVVVDTLRADHVDGSHGHLTPGIDGLAADGVVFERALAHAPMTLPSHTALFSSRYPHVTGVTNNGQHVGGGLPMIAPWLTEHGFYTSGVISIGTLWGDSDGHGVGRGFDRYDDRFDGLRQAPQTRERLWPVLEELPGRTPFFLFAHFSDPHAPYNAHGTAESTIEIVLDDEVIDRVNGAEMGTWVFERELDPGAHVLELRSDERFRVGRASFRLDGEETSPEMLEGEIQERGRRFACRLANQSDRSVEARFDLWIHDSPLPEEIRRRYALEVRYVDRVLGELFAELRRLGLYEDSLIVFTADHGEGLGEHGLMAHVGGLWDEQVHVPLIIKLPRGHEARESLERARDGLVRHIDVVPTVLDLLGLPPLPGQMGVSLLEEHERVHFAETHAPEAPEDILSLRDASYKLLYRPASETFEMYDLAADPDEEVDVFAERGHLRASWQEQLRALASGTATFDRGELDAEVQDMLKALGY